MTKIPCGELGYEGPGFYAKASGRWWFIVYRTWKELRDHRTVDYEAVLVLRVKV